MVYAKCSKCSSRWLLPRKDIGTKTECCIGGKYLQDNFVRKIIPKQEPIQEPKKEIPLKSKEEYEKIARAHKMTTFKYSYPKLFSIIWTAISERRIPLFWRFFVLDTIAYLSAIIIVSVLYKAPYDEYSKSYDIRLYYIGYLTLGYVGSILSALWLRGYAKFEESLFKKRIKIES